MVNIIKRGCRKYGGALEVKDPFPSAFEFQLTELHIVDNPMEIDEYDVTFMTSARLLHHVNDAMDFDVPLTNKPSEAVLLGRTADGYSVACRVPYRPYFFAQLYVRQNEVKYVMEHLANQFHLDVNDFRYEVMSRNRLYGWLPDREDYNKTESIRYIKVFVPNVNAYSRITSYLQKPFDVRDMNKKVWMKPLETKVDHILKFSDLHNIVASGWVRVNAYKSCAGYISHAQIECTADGGQIQPLDRGDLAPLLVASVDIESYSRKYAFPKAIQEEDFVITIGTTLWRSGDKEKVPKTTDDLRREWNLHKAEAEKKYRAKHSRASKEEVDAYLAEVQKKFKPNPIKEVCRMERYVFCLKETNAVPNATVFWYETETELLEGWRDFIAVHADPDIIIGHNLLGFDWKYMNDRVKQMWRHYPSEQERVDRPLFVPDDVVDPELNAEETQWLESMAELRIDDDNDDANEEKDEEDEKEGQPAAEAPHVDHEQDENDVEETDQYTFTREIPESRFYFLTRLWSTSCQCVASTFKSSAYGERENYNYHMTGRAVIDLLQYTRREHKLESYTLNYIAKKFLKDSKVDLPYKLMFKYFERGPRRRALIAEYCLKDCDLPIMLLDFFSAVPNLIGMSRITFTPLTQILERGQQIKVFNQLVWYAHRLGYVMTNAPRGENGKFMGATVVDPLVGWYNCPITTLDFASLYPSIIRDQNLCYATYILPEHHTHELIVKMPQNLINKIKVGDKEHWFVNHIKGVLPTMEENLLKARKDVKKQMKSATGDHYKMLDGKQLAIKVSCNSVFGFTGADKGMYANKAIAESITARGRIMIDKTKNTVETEYPGSVVVYGDTDSVFIKFPVSADHDGVKESFRLGYEAAARVSGMFSEAVGLEMEKVYMPLLLFGKKRYAGLKWEKPEEASYIDTKGIEVVRRDSSQLTRTIFEMLLNRIFYENDAHGAVTLLQEKMQDMVDGKLPFDLFVMSKSLKGNYAKPDSQAHVAVVRKMRERAPGSEPQVGDRVPFVVIQTPQKVKRLSEKVDDPEYVKKNNVELDYQYYIEKQLQAPLTKLFEPFVPNTKTIFRAALAAADRKRNKQRTLEEMFGGPKPKKAKPDSATPSIANVSPSIANVSPSIATAPTPVPIVAQQPVSNEAKSNQPVTAQKEINIRTLVSHDTKKADPKKTAVKRKKKLDTSNMMSLDSFRK